ncbi:DUF1622 domain-containing protein [Actinoallomurus sp. NPDC050550]|uniref:DUF1622 domain-containing protein n=1 Tax=Actinoallomurus sp. NPDC050550 TaxID=3154937 RepID=UPI0033EE700C
MDLSGIAEAVGAGVDLVGVAVIVVGALVVTAVFAGRLRHDGGRFPGAYRLYRQNLGRAILLGLEFLVAADIIRTVAASPTFTSVGVLALIVVVRTFLSFSLEVELEGSWPWRRGRAARPPDAPEA